MNLLRDHLADRLATRRDDYGNPFCLADLDGRVAKCCSCGMEVPSERDLPYFEVALTEDCDRYLCHGCGGES